MVRLRDRHAGAIGPIHPFGTWPEAEKFHDRGKQRTEEGADSNGRIGSIRGDCLRGQATHDGADDAEKGADQKTDEPPPAAHERPGCRPERNPDWQSEEKQHGSAPLIDVV
jgi:hypothetical protein